MRVCDRRSSRNGFPEQNAFDSTTHTITGAIIGVGAARNAAAVRWRVANNIVVAWIVTIPATAFMGAAAYALARIVMQVHD